MKREVMTGADLLRVLNNVLRRDEQRERKREWRAKQPKRLCECGRELERKCRYCSECGYVVRAIKMDINRQNWKLKQRRQRIA